MHSETSEIIHANSKSLTKEMEFAVLLAAKAKDQTLHSFSLDMDVARKDDGSPVTMADTSINKMVIEEVRKAFPNDGIIGEEESSAGPERLWLVDPVDGTHPFSLGIPISTFCLALVEGKQAVLCVVYDPFMGRLYQAVKGEGAFINGRPLQVSNSVSIKNNYFVLSGRMGGKFPTTGTIYDRIDHRDGKSFTFRSSAYGCMLVASGKAAGYIGGHVKPWDAIASKLILEEAGGKVTDFSGGDFTYDKVENGIIASNGLMHEQLITLANQ